MENDANAIPTLRGRDFSVFSLRRGNPVPIILL